MSGATRSRAMAVGLAGGLAGTVVMDLAVAGLFSALGLPVSSSFSFIGDTAALGFALVAIRVTGGVALGTAMHYLIGVALGAAFGLLASLRGASRVWLLKKWLIAGILYIEVVSLPILASAPILQPMTPAATAQWLGLSFCMHLICGAVLGLVMSRGLRTRRRSGATTPLARRATLGQRDRPDCPGPVATR